MGKRTIPPEDLISYIKQWHSGIPLFRIAKPKCISRNTLRNHIARLKANCYSRNTPLPKRMELLSIISNPNKKPTIKIEDKNGNSTKAGCLLIGCYKIGTIQDNRNAYLFVGIFEHSRQWNALISPLPNDYLFASIINKLIIKFSVEPKTINFINLHKKDLKKADYSIPQNESLSDVLDYYNVEVDDRKIAPRLFDGIDIESELVKTATDSLNIALAREPKSSWHILINSLVGSLEEKWENKRDCIKQAILLQEMPFTHQEYEEISREFTDGFEDAWTNSKKKIASVNKISREANLVLNAMCNRSRTIQPDLDLWLEEKKLLTAIDKPFIVPKYKLVKVSRDQLFKFDRYYVSMPQEFLRRTLKVRLQGNILRVLDHNATVKEIVVSENRWYIDYNDFQKDREKTIDTDFQLFLQNRAEKVSKYLKDLVRVILAEDPIVNYRYGILVLSVFKKFLKKHSKRLFVDQKNVLADIVAKQLLDNHKDSSCRIGVTTIKIAFKDNV